MNNRVALSLMALLALLSYSCISGETVSTVYNADKVASKKSQQEGTIVFVRPSDYSVFGTESIRDYVEVTYERASKNSADLLQLDVGLRNKGGQRFYDSGGPNFQLSVKTAFYDRPLVSESSQSVPVYETNWQAVKMIRGATEHYQVICPVRGAEYYQVTISELLK